MALYRFFLACTIVILHAQNSFTFIYNDMTFLSGDVAVRSFFIISGFYMSLVLVEKYAYRKHAYWDYIRNRFFRIYPLYFVILFITAYYYFLLGQLSIEAISFAQILRFIKNSTLLLPPDYLLYIPMTESALLVFPAWTLAVELFFYLIAPLLVYRSNRHVIILLLFGVGLRYLFLHTTVYPYASRDQFFLPNFVFFIMGIISYRLYTCSVIHAVSFRVSIVVVLAFFFVTGTYVIYPFTHKDILYYTLTIMCVPYLFIVDKKVPLKLFGDLSYPLYLSHVIVLTLVNTFFHTSFPIVFFIILVCSYCLHILVVSPFEHMKK